MSKVNYKHNVIYTDYKQRQIKATKALKNEILRTSESYTPLDTGLLKNSAVRSVKSNDNLIIYNTPYARFLYYGKLMIDPITKSAYARRYTKKVITNIDLKYHGGGERGAMWIERAKTKYLKDWIKLYEHHLKRQ